MPVILQLDSHWRQNHGIPKQRSQAFYWGYQIFGWNHRNNYSMNDSNFVEHAYEWFTEGSFNLNFKLKSLMTTIILFSTIDVNSCFAVSWVYILQPFQANTSLGTCLHPKGSQNHHLVCENHQKSLLFYTNSETNCICIETTSAVIDVIIIIIIADKQRKSFVQEKNYSKPLQSSCHSLLIAEELWCQTLLPERACKRTWWNR